MTLFKKTLFTIAVSLFFIAPHAVFALNLGGTLTEDARLAAGFADTTETSLSENVGKIIKSALSLVGTIFLALTVYAGFLWMTAQGEESKIEKAQDIIKSCVIGLLITLSAYGITNFVVARLVESTIS